jgi:hypothetical protein
MPEGRAGAQACAALAAYGLPNALYNLEGGITAWSAAGLPVVGRAEAGLSIFRQVQMIVGGLILIATLIGLWGHGVVSMWRRPLRSCWSWPEQADGADSPCC